MAYRFETRRDDSEPWTLILTDLSYEAAVSLGRAYDRIGVLQVRYYQQEPEDGLCTRWGTDPDRCVLPFEHTGSCQDSAGNTTTSIAADYLRVLEA